MSVRRPSLGGTDGEELNMMDEETDWLMIQAENAAAWFMLLPQDMVSDSCLSLVAEVNLRSKEHVLPAGLRAVSADQSRITQKKHGDGSIQLPLVKTVGDDNTV